MTVGHSGFRNDATRVAQAGNIDAIRTLQKVQANNRFNELVYNMDDDEFTD